MSYEFRDAINSFSGTLSQDRAASDTTLVSSAFQNLPTDYSPGASGKYLPLVLNDFATGASEVVWVNAHTAGNTTVNVLRGQEGTTALPWAAGSSITCAPTAKRDGLAVVTSGTNPASPHIGERVVQTDRLATVERTGLGGWAPSAGMGHPHEQGANMHGATPPNGAVLLTRIGVKVGTTTSNGLLACTFATPFPNGVMAVIPVSTFLNAGGQCVVGAITITGAEVYFLNGDKSRYASATASYMYVAVGW